MKTIYDKEGVTVTLYQDDNDVDIHLEGRHIITMTAQEFDGICQGWRDVVSPVTNLVVKLEGDECFTKLAEDILCKVYDQAEGKRVIIARKD